MAAPYFTAKARSILAAAGGDPDKFGPLAAWAEASRPHGDTTLGVVVAESGAILAETRHNHLGGASYVTAVHVAEADAARWQLADLEVRMALPRLRRITGQRVLHVTFSDVCLGAGAHVREA